MRQTLLILFTLLSINVFSQNVDTCFTKNEIINIAYKIKVLQRNDTIQSNIIKQQDSIILDYQTLKSKDDTIIGKQDYAITKYKDNEKLYEKIIKDYKNNWKQRLVYGGIGLGTGIILRTIFAK